jgi:hypothetical protein
VTPLKRRTRAHVIADLSVNHVERVILQCGYTVVRNTSDYGIDLYVQTFTEEGEVEAGDLKIQVKATDQLPLLADGRTISFGASTADLVVWKNEPTPVILVLYDGEADRSYWLDVREFAWNRTPDPADWRTKTVHIRIPIANRFTRRAVKKLRAKKNGMLGSNYLR